MALSKTSEKKSVGTIKVYSTPTCPYCEKAKAFLKENNIPYKDINVANNPAAADELIEKSGQMGVPVLEINGKIIVGYDREAIKKALKL